MERGVARAHLAEVADLRREVAGDAHGHGADAAWVAAQVDDDAVGGAQRVHGLVERARHGDQPDVEADEADLVVARAPAFALGLVQVAPGELGGKRGQRAELAVRTLVGGVAHLHVACFGADGFDAPRARGAGVRGGERVGHLRALVALEAVAPGKAFAEGPAVDGGHAHAGRDANLLRG